ncbi:MAG: vanadium-dependent haloperoxidase [Bacteroidia bacterium]|nr:vanadium-dependent haloperoxidase [Bacteroidia bacterium]NNF32203.1 vanadium-dependent haloperoxidase [Flavobacteriaceae bacterium]MBT8276666.1 vanadium-dependent haloperoxidase [Bacteroidia bacterium]NNJ82111.1 vanadium-dependent haloperoxidase [Flavobacteriaceae bacterium]NNK55124.1 vanadium-dependent haloperoxidase [Flavobacteriaceae bacterium]
MKLKDSTTTMRILPFLFLVFLLNSCQEKQELVPVEITPEDYQNAVDHVTEIMIHDIFSPPQASRIYVYPNIAAYEIISHVDPDYKSLAGQITDFTPIPTTSDSLVNYPMAALIAHMDLSKALVFSEEKMTSYSDSLNNTWSEKNNLEFEASKEYAMKVVDHMNRWIDADNYKQTRTMSKFTVDIDDPARWQPTPPAYMDGIEPHWNKIRPLVLDSAAQFKPEPPPPFSMEKNSEFYKELEEVYEVSEEITKKGDESEEIEIAQFWDCNPYVSVTRGHLMFATKKITPGAHWMGITEIACKDTDAEFNRTVHAYTKSSIAMFDAFISCWDEKYRSNLIRPETLINQYIDENWKPILQTPPFPEYVSGHSVVSGAAATVLTEIFGDNFSFMDDTELPYGLPVRGFDSFNKAAEEAAVSRLYGGIHYRAAIDEGLTQGQMVGQWVIQNLQMKQ